MFNPSYLQKSRRRTRKSNRPTDFKKPISRYGRGTINRKRPINRWERPGGHSLYPLTNPTRPELTEIIVVAFVLLFYLLWAVAFIASVVYITLFILITLF